jgi:hypothetical protein
MKTSIFTGPGLWPQEVSRVGKPAFSGLSAAGRDEARSSEIAARTILTAVALRICLMFFSIMTNRLKVGPT